MFRTKERDKHSHAEWRRRLERDGVRAIHLWLDQANAYYPPHAHDDAVSVIVVLEGEMTITISGCPRVYRAEERCDIPKGKEHEIMISSRGCSYLSGKKQ